MGHVFISYSRQDIEVVAAIVEELEEAGLDIWIDRDDMKAGHQWRLQIVKAIDTADSFVLHLSPAAAASKNVRKELDLAENATDPFMLLVMLAEMDIPAEMRYQLAGTQFISVFDDPISSYQELRQILLERKEELDKERQEPALQREVELIIQGDALADLDGDKQAQAQLQAFLAQLTNTNPDELIITRIEEDSIHVFIQMPSDAAYALKAHTLGESCQLAKAGIIKLRFVGDKKFISTPKPSTP